MITSKGVNRCTPFFTICRNFTNHSRRIGVAGLKLFDIKTVHDVEKTLQHLEKIPRILSVDEFTKFLNNNNAAAEDIDHEEIYFLRIRDVMDLNLLGQHSTGENTKFLESPKNTCINYKNIEEKININQESVLNAQILDTSPTVQNFSHENELANINDLESAAIDLEQLMGFSNKSFKESLSTQCIKSNTNVTEEQIKTNSKEDKNIFDFAIQGDLENLKNKIEENSQNLLLIHTIHGGSLLHAASYNGHSEILIYLIKKGLPINFQSKNGSTPLHWAASGNQPEICKILLESGADPALRTVTWRRNFFGRGSGQTAYHWAAESGYTEVLQVLCDFDLGPSAMIDERGITPSQLAKKEGKFECEDILIEMQKSKIIGIKVKKFGMTKQAIFDVQSSSLTDL